MSKRYLWLVIGVAILLCVWWFGHRGEEPNKAASSGRSGASAGPIPVVAGKVEQKDVPIYLDGLGTVQAFNTVTVRTRVDGELTQVLFKEGQDIKTGDLLAVVDPRPYQAALDQAIAKKAGDEAQLGNAQVVLARNTDLIKKQVIDQQTYDTSKFTADQFKGTVEADAAAIETARTQLDYTQIKSPINGRIGIRMVDAGNVIHAADTNGIVVITQLKPISVVFTLPEQDLQELLNQGNASGSLPVEALDRGNTAPLGQGTLSVIDNEIDQATGTVKLKAIFPNEDLKLWPGKFVNARLVLKTQKDATVVPAQVVQRGPQGSYAYIIKSDKTVAMQTVKVGPTENGQTVINSGLTPGQEVVVDGQYKLQPGAHVELVGPPRKQQAAGEKTPSPHGHRGKS
ncbi:MAG TPA: efflux RND transporter periplasmic adaptor subunit [Chthoniobacterales bacterium]